MWRLLWTAEAERGLRGEGQEQPEHWNRLCVSLQVTNLPSLGTSVPSDSRPEQQQPVPVSQVVPGVLRSPRLRGDEDRTRVPCRRLLVLRGVFRHHCCFCLPVLPGGHRGLHLPSEQIPREQPWASHRECGCLLNHFSRAVTVLMSRSFFF